MTNRVFRAAACVVTFCAPVLAGASAFGQDLETVARADVAAALCPAEWSAMASFELGIWEALPAIGIDPTFEKAATNAYNKYVVSVTAMATHIGDVYKVATLTNRSDLALVKAKFDLSNCLALTPNERDLLVKALHNADPSTSKENLHSMLFRGRDSYVCMNFVQAYSKVFELDPEASAYQSEVKRIMETTLKGCGTLGAGPQALRPKD